MQRIVPVVVLLTVFQLQSMAQSFTRTTVLQQAATQQATKERSLQTSLQRLAQQKNWPLVTKDRNGVAATLTGVDAQGYPIYTSVYNNIISAATIGTSKLWSGGSAGLSLSGSLDALKDKLVLWDGGKVRATHVELNNRIVHRDNASSLSDHSTHVAGTMMALGIKPEARGMASGLQELVVYDYNNNGSEMLTESANNILLSNHSYGTVCGWYYTDSRWEFRGQWNATEDYKFGFYSDDTQLWDSIAYNAPYHLIVKSAGNNRTENGPAVGEAYYRYNASGTMAAAGNRPDGIYSNDAYDILPTTSTAKNILTVGAINPLAAGYTNAAAVSIASFSSWGPTDDGRIKPDVVADGVNVLSSVSTADNAYGSLSGTSMASPAATGSLLLLQEYYANLHSGSFMKASTLKGLVIHTADEAGAADGPDYIYGWGLINMARAASVITANNTTDLIQEGTLANGQTISIPVIASGKGKLVATLCWTDPKGIPHAIQVDNSSLKLIHDLDIRIKKGSTTYLPWILDPAAPAAAATKGDNFRDNIEKVELADVVPGATYTIEITHKGTLERGSQVYSLIVSGAGGTAYCATSAPSATAGARIDNLSFAGISSTNATGCTGYTDNTNVTGSIQANTTIPFAIHVSSCDGSTANKIVKAYIDLNSDGDFTDAGEQIVESGVLTGEQDYNTTVTIPAGLTPGYYTILRVIVQETSIASEVSSCGVYGKGETQDYRISFADPSTDASITAFASPLSSACSSNAQYVTVTLKNAGAAAIANVSMSGTVKQGTTTVASLSGSYAPSIGAQEEINYTFQTPFTAEAGKTYTLSVKTDLANDQNTANDALTMTTTVNTLQGSATGEAEICSSNNVLFKATDAGSDAIFWYDSPTATLPIAAGSAATSSVITSNKTYYLGRNDVQAHIGPANKTVYSSGNYAAYSGNFVKFTTYVPLTIETVKLYTGYAGKIEIILADFGSYTSTGYTYYPITSTILDAYATDPTPVSGTQSGNDAGDNGAVFAVNLSVPTPGDHIIVVKCSEGATLFRNDAIAANPYPFSIPGVMDITGNSAGGNTNQPTLYQQYYYFFYDMGVRLSNCPGSRTAVVASSSVAPVVSASGNTLSSSFASGNQWYLGSSAITGATAQTYVPVADGTYKVEHTDDFGCTSTSNELSYSLNAGLEPIIELSITPNPSNGQFKLDFTSTKQGNVGISIVDVLGQTLYKARLTNYSGTYSETINVGRPAPGVYVLRIRHGNKDYSRKLIIR